MEDNYTSVSTKGKAVVDYTLVPHDCLTQLVDNADCVELIGEGSRLPDHSMLYLEFQTGQVTNQSEAAPQMVLPYSRGKVCRKLQNPKLNQSLVNQSYCF